MELFLHPTWWQILIIAYHTIGLCFLAYVHDTVRKRFPFIDVINDQLPGDLGRLLSLSQGLVATGLAVQSFAIVLVIQVSSETLKLYGVLWLYTLIPIALFFLRHLIWRACKQMWKWICAVGSFGIAQKNLAKGALIQQHNKRALKRSRYQREMKRACQELLDGMKIGWDKASDRVRFFRDDLSADLLDTRERLHATIQRLESDIKKYRLMPKESDAANRVTFVEQAIIKHRRTYEKVNAVLLDLMVFLDLDAESYLLEILDAPDGENRFLLLCDVFCHRHGLPREPSDANLLAALEEIANCAHKNGTQVLVENPEQKRRVASASKTGRVGV